VQAAKNNVRAARAIMIGNAIRSIGVRDVNLNDDEVWLVVKIELLNMLILQADFELRIEIGRKRCQTKRRKQRVLDWPTVRTRSFRQGRKNQFYSLN